MRDLIVATVKKAAESLGLDPERVMTKSAKDNLTLPRPRVELDFLPENFQPTGRKLGLTRLPGENQADLKTELYEVELPIAAQVLADDEDWLKDFAYKLVAALPRGFNDKNNNYVRLRAQMGEWEGFSAKRVGVAIIDPIIKRGYLIHLTAWWRITKTENINLLHDVRLNIKDSSEENNG